MIFDELSVPRRHYYTIKWEGLAMKISLPPPTVPYSPGIGHSNQAHETGVYVQSVAQHRALKYTSL